jgi:hypothetical protein
MDGNGARHLRRRLESHEHWRQAEAVQTGAQPAADPDVRELVELADGLRRYRDGLCKRLVEGRWVATLEDEPAALADLNGA